MSGLPGHAAAGDHQWHGRPQQALELRILGLEAQAAAAHQGAVVPGNKNGQLEGKKCQKFINNVVFKE